jgi:hypothetical protein
MHFWLYQFIKVSQVKYTDNYIDIGFNLEKNKVYPFNNFFGVERIVRGNITIPDHSIVFFFSATDRLSALYVRLM